MVTTCPWFFLIIAGKNSLVVQKWAMVLTSKVNLILSSDSSMIDKPVPTPALLMRTVGSPCAFLISDAVELISEEDVTSH